MGLALCPPPHPTHSQDYVAVTIEEAAKGAGRNRHHLHGLERERRSDGPPWTTQGSGLPPLTTGRVGRGREPGGVGNDQAEKQKGCEGGGGQIKEQEEADA